MKVKLVFVDNDPKKPYLISDTPIPYKDTEMMFNISGKLSPACFDDFLGAQIRWVKRIVATPKEIGWHFVKGMLHHDRAMPDGENTLEEIHPDTLMEISLKRKGICYVESRFCYIECYNYNGNHFGKDCSCKSGKFVDVYRPELVDGKVIIYLEPVSLEREKDPEMEGLSFEEQLKIFRARNRKQNEKN